MIKLLIVAGTFVEDVAGTTLFNQSMKPRFNALLLPGKVYYFPPAVRRPEV